MTRRLRAAFPCLALLVAHAAGGQQVGEGWGGPLRVRSQFQLELPFLATTPQRATLLPKGAVAIDVQLVLNNTLQLTSGHLQRATDFDAGVTRDGYDFLVDVETTRLELRGAWGLTPNIEVFGELPVAMHRTGFLDSFIDDFHEAFGFSTEDRQTRAEDLLDIDVVSGAERLRVDSSREGVGDLVLGTKVRLWDWRHALLSGVAELKAPTGKDDAFLSSGAWDLGVTFLLSAGGPRHAFHGGIGHVFLGRPDRLPLEPQDVTTLFAGYEWRPGGHWSLVTHASLASSFLRAIPDEKVDDARLTLALGGRWEREAWSVHFGLGEDATDNDNSADVVLVVGGGWMLR